MKQKKLKKLHVGLKMNVVDWNLQRCEGALTGYICGELHNALHMKKDKYEILFSITNEIGSVVKDMLIAIENSEVDLDLTAEFFIGEFEIKIVIFTHLNDFDIYINRMEDDDGKD